MRVRSCSELNGLGIFGAEVDGLGSCATLVSGSDLLPMCFRAVPTYGRSSGVSRWPPNDRCSKELADGLKADLRERFGRNERPDAGEYFERFEWLRQNSDLALSLIYEEFCLLADAGEAPDPDEFCRRYSSYRDSLAIQLKCHRELSRLATPVRPTSLLLQSGESWNGFRIGSILGRGGTSTVYLAYEDAMGGRPVALKISADEGPEPVIVGCLDHPRIMPAFSVCRDTARSLRGLCMPYRLGAPLDAVFRQAWPLKNSHGASAFWTTSAGEWNVEPGSPLDRPGWLGFPWSGAYENGVAWIVLVIAQSVAHIHSQGVVHCDIKPSNVYVGVHEGPLLFDFGFARSPRAENALPGGTLAYMAPEQLRAFLDPRCWGEVGPAADLYALGLMLVELLLGNLPNMPSGSLASHVAARWLIRSRSDPEWLGLIVLPRPRRAPKDRRAMSGRFSRGSIRRSWRLGPEP